MLETTDPRAAPVSVPATPKNEAATAAVTAASAPPRIWVRLKPNRRRCSGAWGSAVGAVGAAVTVVAVVVCLPVGWGSPVSGRVDGGVARGSGMTPGRG